MKKIMFGFALAALSLISSRSFAQVLSDDSLTGKPAGIQITTTDTRRAKIPAVVQVDSAGNIVTAGNVAQDSTTTGQQGQLVQCTVTSSDSAYTVGKTDPCTMTATGRIRVGLSSATGLVPATTTVANADMVGCIYRTPVTWTLGYTGGVQCDVNGNLSTVAQGFQARGAAVTANPLLAGCRSSTATPATVSAGSTVDFWCGPSGQIVIGAATSVIGADGTGNSTAGQLLRFDTGNGVYLVTYSSVFNGSTWDRQRGDTSGTVSQPYAMTGSRWQYVAAAGGITNTSTAVTVASAGGASVRNYVTGIQCTFSALGAATEFGLRDGAGGSFLWRMYVGTAGGTFTFNGPIPLKGTANTLVEVVTLTPSVTGAGYCNVQGYTAL